MQQPSSAPTLFSTPLARNSDPETSHQAAFRAAHKAPSARQKVYDCLNLYPQGLTDFELSDRTGLGDNARKRRSELAQAGLVAWNGEQRLSPSGSWARVWCVIPLETHGKL
jgi:hypothetical protein